ncbi:hydratase [Nocardia neocaledoniensis NBRC 108232]|uniref:Putative amidohydrolase n=2 Tax=Nocardia neocaledoniensis TaxID=236511 RepID=A0A317NGQ6_9NOCA|nr:putative amidohydrolase [Nocardia neocaledoniensis]GEM28996.1 hydratase [Nocardia neocaledoniensis NBRC 108232]
MSISPVTIAVVQFDPRVGLEHRDRNLTEALAAAATAADDGATLIVLPELSSSGYSFADRAEAYAHAESVDGPFVEAWCEFAASRAVHVVVGFAELEGMRLFDTAALIGPDGLIGVYRKTHLWNQEKLWFSPGDVGFPVFETRIGRIGMLICWDIWFPEVPRILAQQGADIICSSNNWVWTPPPLFDSAGRCMANYLTMTAAHSNNVFIAAANRTGTDRDAKFLGCSMIAGTNGWPLGDIAGHDDDTIISASVDLVSARSAPIWNDLNDLLRDRRTDLYDPMLGYTRGARFPR